AATNVQFPKISCRAFKYLAAASVDFNISWRSSTFEFTLRPKARAVPGINCQYPDAPRCEVPERSPLSTKGMYLKSSGIPCFFKIGNNFGNHYYAVRCSL